jgi:FkbM family methyltransferase
MTRLTHPEPSLFEKITSRISRKLHPYRKSPITYQYKAFAIELPPYHQLPEHQKRHPKYDRFLPHLARCVDPAETIVDIGANVGDTLAGMVEQNARPTYVCIEPDDAFHRHLENNVERIRASVSGLRVEIIKALVGKNVSNVALVGERGTKHAVASGPGGIESSPLDELIGPGHKVRLLKSDVDGFDYDVLDSSMAIISRDGPMIFFECQYENEHQLVAYRKTLESLESAGYRDWTLFDNFGEVLLRTDDLNAVNQLLDYVWRQNTGRATRTIYYFDILAVRKDDSTLIDRVLSGYT